MDRIITRTERSLARVILWSLGGLILIVALIWGGRYFYERWQEKTALQRAAVFLDEGDLRAASLSARRAAQLNPESAAAARMLASIGEQAGDRSALDWRRKAVELAPDSADDQIALASAALQFDDLPTAIRALAAVGATEQNGSYHAAAARLALAQGKTAEARQHFEKAAQLEPEKKEHQMQLAILNLGSPDVTVAEGARAHLVALRSDPKSRAMATRVLLAEGAKRRVGSEELLRLARELKDYPEAQFSDALLYLDILRQVKHPDYAGFLTEMEEKAQSDPDDLARLITWMNKSNLSTLALSYAKRLKPEQIARWPVPMALADSYAGVSDWAGLESWVKAHPWEGLEAMRRAYLVRALRQQEQTVAAEREWNAAKKEAGSKPRVLSMLTRAAIEWRWIAEAEDLLWQLAKDPSERTNALGSLYRFYSENGDTAGLYRTLLRLVEALPEDKALQNNLAQVGLLLGADTARARKSATELYEKEPGNPAYASTHAFAQFSAGDTAGALQTMEKLPPEKLREPALASYYGIFLAEAGQLEKAREYLRLGAEAPLLPEERALLEKATRKEN